MDATLNKDLTTKSIGKLFTKYALSSTLAMIGLSLYIVVDTFFISKAVGTLGIAAINIIMPVFNLMFAFARLIEIGAGTLFAYHKAQDNIAESRRYFTLAVITLAAVSAIIIILGFTAVRPIATISGANSETLPYAEVYLKYVMAFAPAFIFASFLYSMVRNDNAPTLAMIAMVACTALNILLDYVFMFPLKMGMKGAALATCLASTTGCVISAFHLFSKKNNCKLIRTKLEFKRLFDMVKLGISSFTLEICNGIVIILTNVLLIKLSGNTAVAMYAVLMAFSYLAVSMFQGIGQGIQPIFSENAAVGRHDRIKKCLKLAYITTLSVALVATAVSEAIPQQIIAIFNSENSAELAAMAPQAIRLFSIFLVFCSVNILTSGYFTAIGKPVPAFIISILRSFVLLIPSLYILSAITGLTGVWLTVPVTEFIVAFVSILLLIRNLKSFKAFSLPEPCVETFTEK